MKWLGMSGNSRTPRLAAALIDGVPQLPPEITCPGARSRRGRGHYRGKRDGGSAGNFRIALGAQPHAAVHQAQAERAEREHENYHHGICPDEVDVADPEQAVT